MTKWCKFFILNLCLSFGASLFSLDLATKDIEFPDEKDVPWLQGPLLTPSGYLVEPGHVSFQPYYNSSWITGVYNSKWHYEDTKKLLVQSLFAPIKFGLTQWMDFAFAMSGVSKSQGGKSSTNFGDIVTGLSFRLKEGDLMSGWPAFRLSYRVIFPTGKYKHLDGRKAAVDSSGDGIFWQVVALSMTKLWQLSKTHFFEFRAAATYFIAPPSHVSGYNIYSTKLPLKAKVYGGNVFITSSSIQYNLSKRWGVSLDALYRHKDKVKLKTLAGYKNVPSTENFSLAPAIGYGFNENLGLLGGVWFSVLGRNSSCFRQAVLSFNLYY